MFTRFMLEVETKKDFVPEDVSDFVETVNGMAPLFKMTGFGKRIGLKGFKTKLVERN